MGSNNNLFLFGHLSGDNASSTLHWCVGKKSKVQARIILSGWRTSPCKLLLRSYLGKQIGPFVSHFYHILFYIIIVIIIIWQFKSYIRYIKMYSLLADNACRMLKIYTFYLSKILLPLLCSHSLFGTGGCKSYQQQWGAEYKCVLPLGSGVTAVAMWMAGERSFYSDNKVKKVSKCDGSVG